MQLIHPSVEILTPIDAPAMLKMIERAGRVCYKTEDRITDESAPKFVKMIIGRQHDSVLEHQSITFKLITDRSVTHELVRHRLASFSQESQRYVDYEKKGVIFVIPETCPNIKPGFYEYNDEIGQSIAKLTMQETWWFGAMMAAEEGYNQLRKLGQKPEQARDVLPNSTKTEIVTSCNLRELRHILKLRTSRQAHPRIRALMIDLYDQLVAVGLGIIFEDIAPFRD